MNRFIARNSHCLHKPIWVLAGALMVSVFSMAQADTVTPEKKKHKTPSQSRVMLKSQATQMASGIRAAEAALSPQELAVAQRIEVGRIPCELGAYVSVVADPQVPGYFDVQIKKLKFRMAPVLTKTGAIRMEDFQAGAVWLQLSNKSMLMNQKTGVRLADACTSPAQLAVADDMVKNPPPSLLEPLPFAASPEIQRQTAKTIPTNTVR